MDSFVRTTLIYGERNMEKLKKSKVIIFGVGGVGSYVCEALIRSGIENFVLVDNDTINASNLNRQIHATNETIGKYKVDVMKDRMLSINPLATIKTYKSFYLSNDEEEIITDDVSYVVDAVDTVTAKIEIITTCKKLNVPVISSMGTGNKVDPTKLVVTDIYKTNTCPLAKVMRHELKTREVRDLKVVYSTEEPIELDKKVLDKCNAEENSKIIGSTSFVPSAAGLIIASEVVKDITN